MAGIIEGIVRNSQLKVAQKSDEIAVRLSALPDLGADDAIQTLLSTESSKVANFAAGHLALLPGYLDEKRRAADRLLALGGDFLAALSILVQFLPEAFIDRIVEQYVAKPSEDSPFYNPVYEVATFFPGRLRQHSVKIEDPALRTGMLSGGPGEWVEDLAAKYRSDRKANWLQSMGRFHTAKAARSLLDLATVVPSKDRDRWSAAVENAGLMPDGFTPSVYAPAQRGFVRPKGETPHAMGGAVPGAVPLCPACQTPACRVLTLRASELTNWLRVDASFYWFNCSCEALPFLNLQMLPGGGIHVLIGPEGSQGSTPSLVPGEFSLLLEAHPNPAGSSLEASGGFARHQVGGFPPWIQIEAFPFCPLCQKPMHFLAAIDSGMTPFGRLRFSGILYGFWCNDCATTTTFRQAG